MKLPRIKTFFVTKDPCEQASKVFEEAVELFTATILWSVGRDTKEHVEEEALDVLQAVVNFLAIDHTEIEVACLYRENLKKNSSPDRYGKYM